MPKKFTVAQGWKFIRPDGTHFMLWQYETYRVTSGIWEGTTGYLLEVIDCKNIITVKIGGPGGYVVVSPEDLEEVS